MLFFIFWITLTTLTLSSNIGSGHDTTPTELNEVTKIFSVGHCTMRGGSLSKTRKRITPKFV